jgi:hypothetical protein
MKGWSFLPTLCMSPCSTDYIFISLKMPGV